jgi:peptide-methionine (S)-S-oxide reductase
LKGVSRVVSGYAGGETDDPSYDSVCSGTTGHAEVIQVEFDPGTISFRQILDVFWSAHDPTTKNRQGADVGSQYRSIILAHSEEQLAEARASMAEAGSRFQDPIVTEIEPLTVFYPAEDYHQDFYDSNVRHPYCQAIIAPKLQKLFQS